MGNYFLAAIALLIAGLYFHEAWVQKLGVALIAIPFVLILLVAIIIFFGDK